MWTFAVGGTENGMFPTSHRYLRTEKCGICSEESRSSIGTSDQKAGFTEHAHPLFSHRSASGSPRPRRYRLLLNRPLVSCRFITCYSRPRRLISYPRFRLVPRYRPGREGCRLQFLAYPAVWYPRFLVPPNIPDIGAEGFMLTFVARRPENSTRFHHRLRVTNRTVRDLSPQRPVWVCEDERAGSVRTVDMSFELSMRAEIPARVRR